MSRFTGQAAFVTGASSGIGRACAFALAREGAAVLLAGLGSPALEKAAAELRGLGANALAVATDVTNPVAAEAAVQQAVTAFGGLAVAVAAAGVAIKGTVTEGRDEDWHLNIGVNLTGVYNTARHTMPHLIASGRGAFVAISSDAGVRGSAGYSAYSASKHGVIGLVRCLALDYGPKGVRSNVVCPSFVDTPMASALLDGQEVYNRSFYEKRVPLGRFAQPQEVADAVLHLSSPEASYANGMTYVLDGGTTAGTFG